MNAALHPFQQELVDRMIERAGSVKLLVTKTGPDSVMIEAVRESDLVSVPDIARMAGVSPATVRRWWIAPGILRTAFGTKRYKRTEVQQLIDRKRRASR